MSVRKLILQKFRKKFKEGNNGFVNSQKIQDVIHKETFKKHETIGRILRTLAEENFLEREEMKMENSKVASVFYKYKPTSHEIQSRVMLERLKV